METQTNFVTSEVAEFLNPADKSSLAATSNRINSELQPALRQEEQQTRDFRAVKDLLKRWRVKNDCFAEKVDYLKEEDTTYTDYM